MRKTHGGGDVLLRMSEKSERKTETSREREVTPI